MKINVVLKASRVDTCKYSVIFMQMMTSMVDGIVN